MNQNINQNIKEIINIAINKKQAELQKMTDEYNHLKNQEQTGVYYMPVNMNPDTVSPMKYFAVSFVTLISEVLNGFHDAAKTIRDDTTTIENAEKNQYGGKQYYRKRKDGKKIKDLANSIMNTVTKTNQLVDKNMQLLMKQKGGNNGINDTNANINNTYEDANINNTYEDENPVGEVLTKVADLGEAGVKTGIKISADIISTLIDWGLELTGEEKILETPFSELTAGLNKKLLVFAGAMKEVSTNPITREAVKEIAEAVGITLIEIMKEIKPEVDKVTEQGVEMMEGVAEKFTTGAANTSIAIAQSFIAEIPWIGGVIDMFIAIGKGFNTLMQTFSIFMEKTNPMILTTAHTIKNTENKVVEGKNRIEGAVNNVRNKMAQLSNSASNMGNMVQSNMDNMRANMGNTGNMGNMGNMGNTGNMGNVVSSPYMRGGDTIYSKGNLQRMIQNGGKRLRKTLKLFDKTVPKMKFRHYNKSHNLHMHRKTKKNKKYNM